MDARAGVRRALRLVLVPALLSATACAPKWPPAPIPQRELGRIGIVTSRDDPEYRFQTLLEGKGQGAGLGAGAGAAACFEALASSPPRGQEVLVVPLFLLVCMPIMAAVGAVAGATLAAPAQSVEDLRARAERGLAALHLNADALQAELDYAHTVGLTVTPLDRAAGPAAQDDTLISYAQLAGTVDSVIELNVQRVSAITTGTNDLPVSFVLEGRVRTISARDGHVLRETPVFYHGLARTADAWLAADGAAVHEELQLGVRSLALQALDGLLLYRPWTAASEDDDDSVPPYALRVIDPPLRVNPFGNFPNPFKDLLCGEEYQNGPTWGWLERYELETRQPMFRWEALPRSFDLVIGDAPGQAQDVRYDLRIFYARGRQLADATRVAYERYGLVEPSHVLEEPLPPCDEFRWTVRARFSVDGDSRATEWTGAYNSIGAPPGSGPAKPDLLTQVLYYPIVQSPSADGESCSCR